MHCRTIYTGKYDVDHCYALIFLIVIISSLLLSCGSGSGGGSGDNNNSDNETNRESVLSYAGATTQAFITRDNAAHIARGAFNAGSYGTGYSTLKATQDSSSARPLLPALVKALEEAVHKIEFNPSPSGVTASKRHSDRWSENGSCGGTVSYSYKYNDSNRKIKGSETYKDYCDNGWVISGKISFHGVVNTYTGKYRQLTLDFAPLSTRYQDSAYIIDGTIMYNYDTNPSSALINLLIDCGCNGYVYKYEDFKMELTSEVDNISFEISGRFYDPEHGYVDLSNKKIFHHYKNEIWPQSGRMKFIGSSGTSAGFSILSVNEYAIEVDANGDGAYDWSRILRWNEDTYGGRPDETAPGVPTRLTINMTPEMELKLSWDIPEDNIGVSKYNIYRNGTYIKTVKENSTTDINLDYNTQYCYTVSALDTMNNESLHSKTSCKWTIPQTYPIEKLDKLDFSVIGAEYSDLLDKIIMISSSPSNSLYVYDPQTGLNKDVKLDLKPTSMSIAPDGQSVAVGHDGWVSIININSATLIKKIPVSIDVGDVVLSGNGYVYAFPKDEWRFRCINIDTETETLHSGPFIFSEARAISHPNGTSLYALISSDIKKYDISNGTAELQYESPDHPNIGVCGDLWISEDGLRLFTGCGSVFRISENQSEDMLYNGTVRGSSFLFIKHLDHSLAAQKVIAIPNHRRSNAPNDTELYIYDYPYLTNDISFDLPSMGPDTSSGPAHGKFVFINADGTDFYVIAQDSGTTDTTGDYGVITYSLQIMTKVESPVVDNPYGLGFTVIDAEYSRELDKIVIASSTPSNRIYIYDPEDGQSQSIDLNLPPTSLSVGPDGLFAAIGHDGWVSHIDLSSGTLKKTIPVTTVVKDIILADNGYVYAFPQGYNSDKIRCIHIGTDSETLLTGRYISGRTLAKLHPDGTYIYGAESGSSPADIEKYAITDGTAAYLYDSPYHGDYPMCGDLWISDDGNNIFTKCGNVFRASEYRSDDMTYTGALSETSYIEYISQSSAAEKAIVIPTSKSLSVSPEPLLHIYDYPSLSFDQTIELPLLEIGADVYPRYGKFVFFNSSGDQYYVIVQADTSSGLIYDYGIISYSTE